MAGEFRLVYSWTDNFQIIGLAKVGYLFSEASDSPIVDVVGSEFQWTAGVAAAYKF